MKVFRGCSNQWALGFGLRRSTIYGDRRWMLWWNYGFKSASVSWGRNPPAPAASQGGSGGGA